MDPRLSEHFPNNTPVFDLMQRLVAIEEHVKSLDSGDELAVAYLDHLAIAKETLFLSLETLLGLQKKPDEGERPWTDEDCATGLDDHLVPLMILGLKALPDAVIAAACETPMLLDRTVLVTELFDELRWNNPESVPTAYALFKALVKHFEEAIVDRAMKAA